MNQHLPAFLVVAGALAMPAWADTYGEPPSDTRTPFERIKIVPRPAPPQIPIAEPEPAPAVPATATPAIAEPAAVEPTAATPANSIAVVPEWHVSPLDQNFRLALRRWATAADWTFGSGSEFWGVPVDIPITAAATFTGAFEEAVRDLVGATELGEHPLQPCFYSNRVLRVVPISHACDRTN